MLLIWTVSEISAMSRFVPALPALIAAVRQRRLAEPFGFEDALGRRVHVRRVRAIRAMHRHALADRHEAHDGVAGHRAAALRQPHQYVVDAGDADAAGVARHA